MAFILYFAITSAILIVFSKIVISILEFLEFCDKFETDRESDNKYVYSEKNIKGENKQNE